MPQHDCDPSDVLLKMTDAEIVALLQQTAGYMIVELARRGHLSLSVDEAAVERNDAAEALQVEYQPYV